MICNPNIPKHKKLQAHAVKMSKSTLLEEVCASFGFQLFIGKRSILADYLPLAWEKISTITSIKVLTGYILMDKKETLSRWKEYLEDLLNLIRATTTNLCDTIDFGKEEVFTLLEVAAAIRGLKSGKAAGQDEIRSEMLMALNEGVRWLISVCQAAWKLRKTPKDWQTGVIIFIYKKDDSEECTNYRRISLLSLPVKVYAKCLEKKCREIVESILEDSHRVFFLKL